MEFKPIFFSDKLKVINPHAAIGLVTLWSNIDSVLKKLNKAGVNLDPKTSKIAVAGNLYGEGFRYMLRNLLYNPQIDTLIVLGKNNSGSIKYITNFFEKGTEPANIDITYKSIPGISNISAVRILDTDYYMDNLISKDLFLNIPDIVNFGNNNSEGAGKVAKFLETCNSRNCRYKRIKVPVPEVESRFYPSNIIAHTILEQTASEAWKRLIHRIFRFGKKVTIRKGKRQELQNVKVIIERPCFEDSDTIKACGFDPKHFIRYQKAILSPKPPSDTSYTYGNRIRAYFKIDCLDVIVNNLKYELDDRNCYITTWDNTKDINGDHRPCLVSLFFRKDNNKLYLTANFRTHNASNAWLENVYGLIAIQDYVCKKIGSIAGAVTVISHCISLDPNYLEKAGYIYEEVSRKKIEKEDPNGYFIIKTEGSTIIAQQWHNSNIINKYRSEKPIIIQKMISKDCAVSDINHAIYIGRQLERAYFCIQNNIPYIQK